MIRETSTQGFPFRILIIFVSPLLLRLGQPISQHQHGTEPALLGRGHSGP